MRLSSNSGIQVAEKQQNSLGKVNKSDSQNVKISKAKQATGLLFSVAKQSNVQKKNDQHLPKNPFRHHDNGSRFHKEFDKLEAAAAKASTIVKPPISLLSGSMDDISGSRPPSGSISTSNSDLPPLPPQVRPQTKPTSDKPPSKPLTAQDKLKTAANAAGTAVEQTGNHAANMTVAPTAASFATESAAPDNLTLGADLLEAYGRLGSDMKNFSTAVKNGKGRTTAAGELAHTALRSTDTTVSLADSLGSTVAAAPGIGLATGTLSTLRSGKKLADSIAKRNAAQAVLQSKNTPDKLKQIAQFTLEKTDKRSSRAGIAGVVGASNIASGALLATGVGAVAAVPIAAVSATIGGLTEGQKVFSKGSKVRRSGGTVKETMLLRQDKVAQRNEQKIIAGDANNLSTMSKPDQQLALARQNPAGQRKHMSNALVASIQEGGPDSQKYQNFAKNVLGIKEKYLDPKTQEDADKLTALVARSMSST